MTAGLDQVPDPVTQTAAPTTSPATSHEQGMYMPEIKLV